MHDTCNGVSGGMLPVSEVHTRVALAPWCMHIREKPAGTEPEFRTAALVWLPQLDRFLQVSVRPTHGLPSVSLATHLASRLSSVSTPNEATD